MDTIFIVRALLLHDLRRRYMNSSIGFLSEFLRPTMICAAHWVLFSIVSRSLPQNLPIECFVLGGFSVWFTYSGSYHAGLAKLYYASVLPGVTRMHVRMAHCAWAYFSNVFFLYVCVFGLKFFGDPIPIPDVPATAIILFTAGTMGFGVGLIWEGICRIAPYMEMIAHVFPWVLYVSSGIYFSLAQEITQMAAVFVWNPLLHLLELERWAFNPGYPIGEISPLYAGECAVGALLIGLLTNRKFRLLIEA
jgi:capsular polysaccharide transport system permease protein